ncbi:MAG TPA: class I SAM-dependent methyltransferase, partial [Enhygromyxa sp.]|nr:class I SAM-dependent methyltransferase [Enhygromyxa sp.]
MKSSSPSANVVGNFEDKYASQNPIARRLVAGFLDAVTELYALADPAGKKVLEVGCGEGKLASALIRRGPTPARYLATDVSLDAITTELDPRIETATASIYELPFASASFDVVVCCEVHEHLDEPARGLAEIARVARERVLISTPWEPVWR